MQYLFVFFEENNYAYIPRFMVDIITTKQSCEHAPKLMHTINIMVTIAMVA